MSERTLPVTGEPGWLVTGSGRCGTGYLASVLQGCGINAGHEQWWRADGLNPEPGLDGDVSWLGCFDHGYTGRVLAQVRDPRQAVPSIHTTEGTWPWYLIRRVTVPLTGVWAVDSALIWLHYTRHAIERAERWWRVETIDTPLLADVFGVDRLTAELVLADTGRDVNGSDHEPYTWPDDPVTGECMALARDLGYDT